MARTADYSDTQKYSSRKSFDGKPVEPGKVLVPFRQDLMEHPKEVCIEKNFTTMHLGGIKFKIGFMAINESGFAAYMQDFWKSINDELTARSSGRCIIGHNPDETDIFCPHFRRCMGCPKKGLHERRIPNHLDILSLNYEYKNEKFDIEDTSLIPVADQIINTLEPESSVDSGGFFMARRRKMDPERKAFISSLPEHYQRKGAQDIHHLRAAQAAGRHPAGIGLTDMRWNALNSS